MIDFLFKIYIILVFFSVNVGLFQNTFLSFCDEVLLGLSIIINFIFYPKVKGGKQFIFFLIIYLAFCTVNFFISPFSTNIIFMYLQAFINIKAFIIIYAGLILFTLNKSDYFANKIDLAFRLSLKLTVIFLIINFVLGENWNTIVGHKIAFRDGFLRKIGHFGVGAYLAYTLVFLIITYIFINNKKTLKKYHVLIIPFLLIFLYILSELLTYRKIILILLPVTWFIIFDLSLRNKAFIYCLIPFSLIVISSLIFHSDLPIIENSLQDLSKYTTTGHKYIRGLMVYHGFELANTFFPFGTSTGTYGTVLSIKGESTVYAYVGLQRWVELDNVGIYDAVLGSLIGELGYLGIICFYLVLHSFYRTFILELETTQLSLFKILYWYAIISTLIGPFIQSGPGSGIFALCVLYLINRRDKEK
ncbi:hypothetical protein [Flammeovirga pacifica]|uniref:O-antigen polymerase n=1 Tax=Flammeovirga pacifica TaxID=915059 RepID=A0A1S1Z1F6_FLAPC|nr:hypothetical protein [Flammeovirga pacifica]OHX67013.1 hypothetical protein NH26_11995 [Flammeovirga pacifica]